MTTTGYEVHVVRDRRWVVAERFPNDSREEAIAAAKRLYNTDRQDGVRVFTERFDSATQLFVPQFIMREIRPGVKIVRDAPAQAAAPAPPVRKAASPPAAATTFANPASSPAAKSPSSGAIDKVSRPGSFDPDAHLEQLAASESFTAQPPEPLSGLRAAGRRALETGVLVVGLLMEGLGFAMLLALLDNSDSNWAERPIWVAIAFGLLLGGLVTVVRQVRRLRKLNNEIAEVAALEPYPTPEEPGQAAKSTFSLRKIFNAIFLNKMPSKWPEPEVPAAEEPAQPMAAEDGTAQQSQPSKAHEPAPIDQLTGFISKFLHGPGVLEIIDPLIDSDSRFAAYLYLVAAAEACVEAAAGGPRAAGPVQVAALEPLNLSAAEKDDFELRRQLFKTDQRYRDLIDLGREAMTTALERRKPDPEAMALAMAEWRMRPPLAESQRIVVLAIDASLAIGGTPPEPSRVNQAFDAHEAIFAAAIEVYRGEAVDLKGFAAFRSAADAAAAAMEIQARRLELSLEDDAVTLDVRAAAAEFSLSMFETRSVRDLLTGVNALALLAIPGDVLVAGSMRSTLANLGYRLRDFRTIPTTAGAAIELAVIDWDGAPQTGQPDVIEPVAIDPQTVDAAPA
jgi:hypothetical protein